VNISIVIEALKPSDLRWEMLVPDQLGGGTMPTLASQLEEVAQLAADPGRASRWPTACGITAGARRRWIRRRPQGRSVEITGEGIAAFRKSFGARI
jgi:hypothetical protein